MDLGDIISRINTIYAGVSLKAEVSSFNPFVQLENAINSFLDSATISNLINSMNKIVKFKDSLDKVQIPKTSDIKKKIDDIFKIRNELLGVGSFDFSDIPVLSQLVSFSNWINDSLNAGSVDAVIKSLKSVIDFENKLNSVDIPKSKGIKDKISELKTIANDLVEVLSGQDDNNFFTKIDKTFSGGQEGSIFAVFGSLFNSWTTGNNAGSIKSALDAINNLSLIHI